MAVAQDTYPTRPAKWLPGQIASEEKANTISRMVESAAGLEFGQPAFRGAGDDGCVVGAAFAATAVGAADAGNTGAGAITASPAVAAPAKQGVYKVVQAAGGATGAINVYDPDGLFVGNGAVGTEFVGGGLTFTVTDPGADPAIGDSYTVTVTYTANAEFLGLAVLNRAVPAATATPDKYPQNFPASLMTMGPMAVVAGEAVGQGDPVHWNPATKRFTKNPAHIRIPDCTFEETGSNGVATEVSLKLR